MYDVFNAYASNADIRDGLIITSARHWLLLASIIDPNVKSESSNRETANRSWLIPLLNHASIASILSHVFNHFASSNELPNEELLNPLARCIQVLWPMAVKRTNLDALSGCYGALLALVSSIPGDKRTAEGHGSHLNDTGVLVASAFRNAIGNAANKKKVAHNFSIL